MKLKELNSTRAQKITDRIARFSHGKKVRVEGFRRDNLLTECVRKNVEIWDVFIEDDISTTFWTTENDFEKLLKITGNSYKITVLNEKGFFPFYKKMRARKATLIGLVLFFLLIFWQSMFIYEIDISGNESLTEKEIRSTLKKAGLYEGCRKEYDNIEDIKLFLYDNLPLLTWVGITYDGSLARIEIVEGTEPIKEDDGQISEELFCDIVAKKDGYIQEVIPLNGIRMVTEGAFVNKGDILIAGTIPLKPTTFRKTSDGALTERYVHAEGTATAKIPYRFVLYQEKNELKRSPTGKAIIGVFLETKWFSVDSAKAMNKFEASEYKKTEILKFIRPIPLELSLSKIEEVTLKAIRKSDEQLKKTAEDALNKEIGEKLPENAQITNKSLNFSEKKNIIEVSVILEALEEIGKEQEIIIGKQKYAEQRAD